MGRSSRFAKITRKKGKLVRRFLCAKRLDYKISECSFDTVVICRDLRFRLEPA